VHCPLPDARPAGRSLGARSNTRPRRAAGRETDAEPLLRAAIPHLSGLTNKPILGGWPCHLAFSLFALGVPVMLVHPPLPLYLHLCEL
jgi:hypothetical protein